MALLKQNLLSLKSAMLRRQWLDTVTLVQVLGPTHQGWAQNYSPTQRQTDGLATRFALHITAWAQCQQAIGQYSLAPNRGPSKQGIILFNNSNVFLWKVGPQSFLPLLPYSGWLADGSNAIPSFLWAPSPAEKLWETKDSGNKSSRVYLWTVWPMAKPSWTANYNDLFLRAATWTQTNL